MKVDKYKVLEKYNFTNNSSFEKQRIRNNNNIILNIHIERCKIDSAGNAKIFMTRAGFKLKTTTNPPNTTLSVTSTNCAFD